MFKKLAVVLLFTGATASIGFASQISENFAGLTSQVQNDGPGIFDVPTSGAPVLGSLTFNSSDFTPDPVAPSGSTYLAAYAGGPGAVSLTLSDSGGSVTMTSLSAFLELSSASNSPWALLVSSAQLAFSLQLDTTDPVTFAPGASVFNLAALYPTSSLSGLVSDGSSSLGFDVTGVSLTPEPGTFGMLLLTSGIFALLLARSRKHVSPHWN